MKCQVLRTTIAYCIGVCVPNERVSGTTERQFTEPNIFELHRMIRIVSEITLTNKSTESQRASRTGQLKQYEIQLN